MATAKPAAVAIRASEIPGATTARLAEPLSPIPRKEFMIPQTVPNKPIKGVVLPVVARKGTIRVMRVVSALMARRRARLIFSIPVKPAAMEAFSDSDECVESDVIGDPALENSSPSYDPGQVNADWFKLTSASIAIDKAVQLPDISMDYFRASRPYGEAPDIGAHEFGGTASPTPTPTGSATPTPSPTESPTPTPSVTPTPTGSGFH